MAKYKRLSPFEIATRRMRYLQAIKVRTTPQIYDYINKNRDQFGVDDLRRLSKGNVVELLPKMTSKFDSPLTVKKAKVEKNPLTGSSKGVLDTSPIQVEQVQSALADEADLLQQNQNADVSAHADSAPDTKAHTPKQSPMTAEELAELKGARNHFKNRVSKATKFYDVQDGDWEAWRIIKDYEKRIDQTATVWAGSPAYKIYDENQRVYAEELNKYAKEKYGAGTKGYKQFMDDYSLDRGHINPKGNRGFSHQQDVTSNIGPEVRTINREHGARMSLREWIEGMNQADMEQRPRIRSETERRLSKLSSEIDDSSKLGKSIKRLRSLPKFNGLPKELADNKLLDINMFDSNPQQGVFIRSMDEMIASGDIKDAHEYERMRRFFLTTMDGNPEFDLDSFMRETGVIPREFREGLPEDGKPPVDWEEVVRGNKQSAKILGNRKALLSRIIKYGLKAPEGVLLFLAGTGASYALSDSDKTYLETVSEMLDMEIERTEGTGYKVLPYDRGEVHNANDQFWGPHNTAPSALTKFASDAVASVVGGVSSIPYNLWQDRNKEDWMNDPANSGEGQIGVSQFKPFTSSGVVEEALPGPPVPYHWNKDGYYEIDAEQTLPGPPVPYHWNEGGYYEVDENRGLLKNNWT